MRTVLAAPARCHLAQVSSHLSSAAALAVRTSDIWPTPCHGEDSVAAGRCVPSVHCVRYTATRSLRGADCHAACMSRATAQAAIAWSCSKGPCHGPTTGRGRVRPPPSVVHRRRARPSFADGSPPRCRQLSCTQLLHTTGLCRSNASQLITWPCSTATLWQTAPRSRSRNGSAHRVRDSRLGQVATSCA